MYITDRTEIAEILMNSPIMRKGHQSCKSRDDFGDESTVPCQVRRIGKIGRDIKNDFGKYLGNHAVGYCVGIYDFIQTGPMTADTPIYKVQVFDTLEALKREWELD